LASINSSHKFFQRNQPKVKKTQTEIFIDVLPGIVENIIKNENPNSKHRKVRIFNKKRFLQETAIASQPPSS
jgi:hypothetical protein